MPTHQLLFGFTIWGFEGIYSPPETGLARLRPAGFYLVETSEGMLDRPGVLDQIRAEAFRLVLQCYPGSVEELKPSLERARELGAVLVNAHAASPHMEEGEAVTMLDRMYDAAEEIGVRLLFETHRGRVTQDLFRTARLCRMVERLRLNLDVSHFVLAEERPGPTPDLAPLLDVILDRTEMLHGRISNGQQIQVDAGDGTGDLARRYVKFWAEAMRRWRLRNRAGSTFVFTPELGPPDYAIRHPATGAELSDRWEQAMTIRALAEEAWAVSKGSSSPLWP